MSKISRRRQLIDQDEILKRLETGKEYTTNQIAKKINRTHAYTKRQLNSLHHKKFIHRAKEGWATQWWI